jgi:cytochrome c peroxidase
MRHARTARIGLMTLAATALLSVSQQARAAEPEKPSSYMPVVVPETFATIMARMKAAKADIEKRQSNLLNDRYDLGDRPSKTVTMTRGKPIQEGVRVKLPKGVTWEQLAAMRPDEIRDKDVFPAGFYPLPHPNHPEGGMLFPHFQIEAIQKQDDRDLTRFDLDFDLPDQFLPEFPPPIFLTTRPDLGDVSQGNSCHRQPPRSLQRHPEPEAA